MMQSENTNELNAALAKAQGAMEAAKLDKNNHFGGKYGSLASIWDAIRKPLSSHGLSVTQTTEIRDGIFLLVTTLRHSSGQWVASEYPLPLTGTAQQQGSAMTYAKRYSLSSIAGIVADEDDDGEGAEKIPRTAKVKNGGRSATLSEEQVHALESAIDITNASLDEFLRWAKVNKLEEIPIERYEQCLRAVPNFGGNNGTR